MQQAEKAIHDLLKFLPYAEIGNEESYTEKRRGVREGLNAALEIVQELQLIEAKIIEDAFNDGYMTVVKSIDGRTYYEHHFGDYPEYEPRKKINESH
jgi:hypothetical protein